MNLRAFFPSAVALAVVLAAAAPSAAQDPPERKLITGHAEAIALRGGTRPENTVAAANRSLAAGATFLQFDVRRTRDGQAVLLCDPTVDRTTDGTGPVAELTLEQVRRLDAGAKDRDPAEPDRSAEGERIPTVMEMIHAVRGRAALVLDLRDAEAAEPTVAALRSEQAFGDVILRSPDPALLRHLKAIDARVRIGATGTMPDEHLDVYLDGLQALGASSCTVPAATRAQVDAFHGKGIAVWAPDPGDADARKALIEAGIDGLFTATPSPNREPSAPVQEEAAGAPGFRAAVRSGLWHMPSFKATLPAGTREFTREFLFDVGVDASIDLDPVFFMVTGDYGVSGQIEMLSGSLQAGLEADLGEWLLPLQLRGSAGVLAGRFNVAEPRFGDFQSGVGFVARVELCGRLSNSLFTSLWAEYRQAEFDFKPTVIAGDSSAGGAMFAVGLSLGVRF